MIVRVWKARATAENMPAYRQHLKTHVFPILQSLSGFLGADLMERTDDEEIEFVVTSRSQSMKAVREFSGDAMERAVVAPGAKAVLASYEEVVAHYEVTAECKV